MVNHLLGRTGRLTLSLVVVNHSRAELLTCIDADQIRHRFPPVVVAGEFKVPADFQAEGTATHLNHSDCGRCVEVFAFELATVCRSGKAYIGQR